MADEKVFSNGNAWVWFVPEASLTTPAAPLASEINAGARLSAAIAWEGTTFPSATESNDIDDRSIMDAGNATSRGYAQMEATLNFFHPENVRGTTTDEEKAYQIWANNGRVPGYLITRVLQGVEGDHTSTVSAGDEISVYKVMSDALADDTEGEDSYKYAVSFLSQGGIYPQTYAVAAVKEAITVTSPSGASLSAGDFSPLRAELYGKRVTNKVNWSSSAPAVASVSNNGVVRAHSAGTADITASHPAGTTSTATTITVT